MITSLNCSKNQWAYSLLTYLTQVPQVFYFEDLVTNRLCTHFPSSTPEGCQGLDITESECDSIVEAAFLSGTGLVDLCVYTSTVPSQ